MEELPQNSPLSGAIWISYPSSLEHTESGKAYYCFIKSFSWKKGTQQAFLHITADYRYTAWLNGQWIGQGPVRGWPDSYAFDSYDVSDALLEGDNRLAVLLHVLDVSTFQYIFTGQSGFAAKLHAAGDEGENAVVTDESWLCRLHPSFGDNTPRISTQQAFVEHYDARVEPAGWLMDCPEGCHRAAESAWLQAVNPGREPKLQPRDIPLLAEETVYPAKVREKVTVKLPRAPWSMDLRHLLLPGNKDANPHAVQGMVVTTVELERSAMLRFYFQDRTSGLHTKLAVNGVKMQPIDDSGQHWSGLFHYDVPLNAGENFLLFWFEGVAHEFTFQTVVELTDDVPVSPCLPGIEESRFGFFVPGRDEDGRALFEQLKHSSDWQQWQAAAKDSWTAITRDMEHSENVFLRIRHSLPIEAFEQADCYAHSCCSGNRDSTIIAAPNAGQAVRLVLEFDRMTAGLLEFELYAPAGTVMDIYGFEAYSGDMIVHMDSMHNTMRYICKQGWQRYRSLQHRSFRYLVIQLSEFTGAIRLRSVQCLLRTYPSPRIGHFRCSEEKLNRIFQMSRWTAALCSDDVFVDCPTYEQAYWVGDAYIMSGVQSAMSGMEPLIARSLLLAGESVKRSPIVESQVPSGWENVLSTWSLLWALACTAHVRRTGDMAFAKRIYPMLKRQTLYIAENLMDERTGLIASPYWNLLDWASIDAPSGAIVTHVNAWYLQCCREAGELAERIGERGDAEQYRLIAEAIMDGMNEFLWDDRVGAFADCISADGRLSDVASEQTQIICYINDAVRQDRRAALLQYVRGEVKDTVACATPFMRFFKLQGLKKAGLASELLSEIRSIWGQMADADSTTCWEDMPGRWSPGYPTRSYCHGWSVAPAYFLPHTIAGIPPSDAWTSPIVISPQPVTLDWAEGSIMSPKGELHVSWERTERLFRASVRLPAELDGMLRIPAPAYAVRSISMNGMTAAISSVVENGCWQVPIKGGSRVVVEAAIG
ncbi:alpha-L-rhamnosidase N-terminal domain-containing protein [Paenibacillus sp. J5C_2022]|uniref:alpha-L-rhamnosidase-related protein n=1 Tax=Paenibacillus sp. J5C2022 TaxID=2977129 RepID=UPI0021D0C2D5|nr:alpha-L-rhamnosidase C-terminal domain-containing protein [Paenibacillus sp. J5C2022]MCU6712301.1 alpha-L-rhamnosidase N-terminal domain-containing protein [Paenibacillus sp. J5C2022]